MDEENINIFDFSSEDLSTDGYDLYYTDSSINEPILVTNISEPVYTLTYNIGDMQETVPPKVVIPENIEFTVEDTVNILAPTLNSDTWTIYCQIFSDEEPEILTTSTFIFDGWKDDNDNLWTTGQHELTEDLNLTAQWGYSQIETPPAHPQIEDESLSFLYWSDTSNSIYIANSADDTNLPSRANFPMIVKNDVVLRGVYYKEQVPEGLIVEHIKNQDGRSWSKTRDIAADGSVRLYEKNQLLSAGDALHPIYYFRGKPYQVKHSLGSDVPAGIDWSTIGKVSYSLDLDDNTSILSLMKKENEDWVTESSVELTPPFTVDNKTIQLDENRELSVNSAGLKLDLMSNFLKGTSNPAINYTNPTNAVYGATTINVIDSIESEQVTDTSTEPYTNYDKITSIKVKTVQFPAASAVASTTRPTSSDTVVWIDTSN